MYKGIVDKVSDIGMLAGLTEIRRRLRVIKEQMHEGSIWIYQNRECIVVETLPNNRELSIAVCFLDDFDDIIYTRTKNKIIGLNKFWDNAELTDWVLE
jgi:hypothetical protein